MAGEDDAEHVVDLALLEVGGGPVLDDGGDLRGVRGDAQLHRDAVHRAHVDELVVHPEPRLLGVVVEAVDAGQEAEALGAQEGEGRADRGGLHVQRGLPAEVLRARDHRLVAVGLGELLGQELQPGGVRHRRCPRSPGR